jgi:hypothetical protein
MLLSRPHSQLVRVLQYPQSQFSLTLYTLSCYLVISSYCIISVNRLTIIPDCHRCSLISLSSASLLLPSFVSVSRTVHLSTVPDRCRRPPVSLSSQILICIHPLHLSASVELSIPCHTQIPRLSITSNCLLLVTINYTISPSSRIVGGCSSVLSVYV